MNVYKTAAADAASDSDLLGDVAPHRQGHRVVTAGAVAAAAAAALGLVAWSRGGVPELRASSVVGLAEDVMENKPPSACSASGVDPWVTGEHVACCPGLGESLHQWEAPVSDRLFWRCYHPFSEQSKMASERKEPTPRDGPQYHPHFDTTPDFLDIGSRVRGVPDASNVTTGSLGDNFYLVIGDHGGCSGGCNWGCAERQLRVAELMKQFVTDRKAANNSSNLLFVLVVGDNFYWYGASPGRFQATWYDVYGEELTSVPWFAILGNHDFGNDDHTLACPFNNPRFECTPQDADPASPKYAACGGANPYSTQYQPYDSNAMDTNKEGVDAEVPHRENWHMMDFTYYYTIPKLDFEIVAMDWNAMDFRGIGGDGVELGASRTRDHCGSNETFQSALDAIKNASTKILNERCSNPSGPKNTAIIGHYPYWAQGGSGYDFESAANFSDFRRMCMNQMPEPRKSNGQVYNFFGHTHQQQCFEYVDGLCVNFLTGGGGGCCNEGELPGGFTAITFDENKKQVIDCNAPDEFTVGDTLPPWYARCNVDRYSVGRTPGVGSDVCAHTIDDPSCPLYQGPKRQNLEFYTA